MNRSPSMQTQTPLFMHSPMQNEPFSSTSLSNRLSAIRRCKMEMTSLEPYKWQELPIQMVTAIIGAVSSFSLFNNFSYMRQI